MIESTTEQLPKTALGLTKDALIRVLHVDDDDDFLIISKRFLERQGSFQIETVSSVKEALQKIRQKKYDVIVSDYQMPEVNGLDFLKELRAEENHVPFILFTGEGREKIAMEALNFGADRYFNKNRNPKILYGELVHSLRKAVKAKRAAEEIRSLAKFPSEDPNPVLRIAKDGSILYVNKAAQKYKCKMERRNKSFVPKILRQAVASSLSSGLTEEVEVKCSDQLFSFMVAPIPEEGYANIYGRNISENKAAWNSLEETVNALALINEKLGVVGRLTRHDGRNKLSIIINNIYLAKQRLTDNPVALGYLRESESAVEQVEKIFDFARTYETVGAEELSYANVKNCVNEATTLFSDLNGTKIVNKCDSLTVLADSLLRQLFYNLIHNSLRHGKNVSQIKAHYKEVGKNQLWLIYDDDGVGIPGDEKEKIFEEGYGKGTGYGLYLIRKICETYGWTIQETGVPGKGAQFIMTIPKTNKNGKLSYQFDTE